MPMKNTSATTATGKSNLNAELKEVKKTVHGLDKKAVKYFVTECFNNKSKVESDRVLSEYLAALLNYLESKYKPKLDPWEEDLTRVSGHFIQTPKRMNKYYEDDIESRNPKNKPKIEGATRKRTHKKQGGRDQTKKRRIERKNTSI